MFTSSAFHQIIWASKLITLGGNRNLGKDEASSLTLFRTYCWLFSTSFNADKGIFKLSVGWASWKYTNWVTNLCYEFNSYLIIKQLAVIFEFMWNQTFRLVQKSRQLTWHSIHLWAAAPWSPGLTPPSHRALSSASRAAAETRSHTAWGKHKTVTPQTASYHWDFGFSPFQNSFFKVEVHSVERSYVALQPLQQFYNNALRCGFADLPVLFPLTPWVFFKSEPASKEWGWKDVLDFQAPHVGD